MNTVTDTGQKLSVREDDYCFVCGARNPVGLKLDFRVVDGRVETVFVPAPEHQGFAGIIHGGLVGLVLDEAMRSPSGCGELSAWASRSTLPRRSWASADAWSNSKRTPPTRSATQWPLRMPSSCE
jgi:hypothetical protein